MKKAVFGVLTCSAMIFGTKELVKNNEANLGYLAVAAFTSNGAATSAGAGAGGAAGWLGAIALGKWIGGTAGAVVGGPVGIIIGSAAGAA